ncbi:MAG: SBBP repeat-containing protein, partial [Candidatus Heimdallarchaeota archaeon]
GNYANSTRQGEEGFVTKFAPNGEIIYSTYIGGTNKDQADSIAVDASYNIYIAGRTYSPDFPTVGVNSNSTFGGESDAYVSKFASDGILIYSTYLGGNVSDNANSISIDAFGNMYVAGETNSNNFPIVGVNANSTYGGGSLDGFVTKISAGGALIFSTFLGGSNYELMYDLRVDNFGNIYVTGETGSADFPIEGINANSTYGGGTDGYVSKLNSSGAIEFSTFLGGNGGVSIRGVTSDANENIYVTGLTDSLNFPIIGTNSTFGGGSVDGTITIYSSIGSVPVITPTTPTITETVNMTQTTTVTETVNMTQTTTVTETDSQISTATNTIRETETTTTTETTTMTGSASTFTTEITFVEKTTVTLNNTIMSTQTSDSSLSFTVFVLSLVLIIMGIRRKKLK